MYIRYFEPLSDAWGRMVKALFKPFDIRKWFIVGFTAFLAGLVDCEGGSKAFDGDDYNLDSYDFYNLPNEISWWISDNPFWATLILIGIILLIIIYIVFTWLSSRGKFMFLDNVVYDKAEIAKPWYEYRNEGNSLFLWRIIFAFISFVGIGIFILGGFAATIAFSNGRFDFEPNIGLLIIGGLLFFIFLVILLYIDCFLDNFVVPLMYKNRVGAINGWSRFLKLFGRYAAHFLLFGLIKAILNIFIVIGVIFIGIFTCCLGFLILIIPYIGDVVLLPISYAFRAFGVEFIEQFGDEYKLFPVLADEQQVNPNDTDFNNLS